MSKRAKPPIEHGTANGYTNRGCRCAPCRKAATDRARVDSHERARRIREDPSLAEHGLERTYRYWGCRCDDCKTVTAALSSARRAERIAALAAGEVTIKHGTPYAYMAYNCRCEPCKAARTEARQNDRDRRAETRNASR